MSLELSILTLNCWGIHFISHDINIRMNAIGDELATGKYDIVSLQEVWAESDFQIIKNKSEKVLPYAHYFYSGVVGSGVCILSKWPIVGAIFHAWRVNGYLHRIQHGDWFGGKGCGLCRINIDGNIVNVYAAHLHAEYNRNSDDYKIHRIIQGFETSQFIESTRGNSILQILAGDLNTEPNDLEYRIILRHSRFIDSFIKSKSNDYGTHESAKNFYTPTDILKQCPDGKRIDYIMYRSGENYNTKLIEYKLSLPETIPNNKISFSDHDGVMAKFQITKFNPSIKLTETNDCFIQNNDNKEEYEDDDNNCLIISENIKALNECIEICNKSIENLESHKRIYMLMGFFVLLLLFFLIDISIPYGLKTMYLLLKILLISSFLYFVLMASIWNRCEYHTIISSKLSMEISLKSLVQLYKNIDNSDSDNNKYLESKNS